MKNVMRKDILIWLVVASSISCGGHKSATNVEVTDTIAHTSNVVTDDGGEADEIQESDFDGDPTVSGSSANIMTITKSIVDGDAKKLASLTLFPIERRYPLRDIKDRADMVRRFNLVFDAGFRKKMQSAKPSDWHSYGWRGYCYGDSSELWVYDSLTIINYYSPQEKNLYGQLVKKEMNSLHASLKGNGWYPYSCYKDITDGSVIRIDIRSRKEMKEENFHKDGVALLYPQLQAFKIRGDEEFRLCIYPKGTALNEKCYEKGYFDLVSCCIIDFMRWP